MRRSVLMVLLTVFMAALTVSGQLARAAAAPVETRAEFVEQVDDILGLKPMAPAVPTFRDVGRTNPAYGYIEAAARAGLITGSGQALFHPNTPITRAEAAKILVLAYEGARYRPTARSTAFTDNGAIPRSLVGYVAQAAALGLVTGLADGRFAPMATLTTSEAKALLAGLAARVARQQGSTYTISTNDASPTTYTAGASTPIVFTVRDASGRPAGGASVTLTATKASGTGVWALAPAPGGPGQASLTMNADAAGTVRVYLADTHVGDTGTVTARLANAGASARTGLLTIASGPPARLVFTSALKEPAGTLPGTTPVTVQLEDAYGNPTDTTADGLTVRLWTSSSTGVFSTTPGGRDLVSSVTIPAGQSSVTFYYGDDTAGSPIITAYAPGLIAAVETAEITGTAGTEVSPNLSRVSLPTATVAAGLGNIALQVAVIGSDGTPVTGLTNQDFRVTSNDPHAGVHGVVGPFSPSDVYYAHGVYTLTLSDTDADGGNPQTLTVSVDGVALAATVSVTVEPGAPVQFVMSPAPIAPKGSLGDSADVQVTVTAEDAAGNPVPSVPIYLSFTSALGSDASATVGGLAVNSSPNAFVTDTHGQVAITFSPGAPVAGGVDTITAVDQPKDPSIVVTDSYTY